MIDSTLIIELQAITIHLIINLHRPTVFYDILKAVQDKHPGINSYKRSYRQRQKTLWKKCRGFSVNTRWIKKLLKKIYRGLLEKQNTNFSDIQSITVEKATHPSNITKLVEKKTTINQVMPCESIPLTIKTI